jgi:hypothetical protein
MTYALTPLYRRSPTSPSTGARTICGGYQWLTPQFDRHDAVEPGVARIADTPAGSIAVGYLVRRYSDSFLPNVSAGSSPMRWSRSFFGPRAARAAIPGLVP